MQDTIIEPKSYKVFIHGNSSYNKLGDLNSSLKDIYKMKDCLQKTCYAKAWDNEKGTSYF